jgi:hypothetical protein
VSEFHYETYQSPFANTIAQLIAHQSDPQAQAAQTIAAANARAGEIGANAWGGAVQNIAGAGASLAQTVERAREQAPIIAMRDLQLKNLQDAERGKAQLATVLAGNTLQPNEEGPRLPTFLTADHHYDIPAVSDWLNSRGLGDQTPDLVAGLQKQNEQLDKSREAQRTAANESTVYIAGAMKNAIALNKIGMPLDAAITASAQQGLNAQQFTPAQVAQVQAQIAAVPPEQQLALAQTFVKRGDALAPPVKLGAQDTLLGGVSGDVMARGQAKPPDRWSLAFDAGTLGKPNETPTAQQSMDALKAGIRAPAAPKLSPEEMDRAAFAKAIGRVDASGNPDPTAVTDKEGQQFDQRKLQNASAATVAGQVQAHAAERAYDFAHPQPVDQTKLEKSYATTLLRAVSSRSGTLGREDARVSDANHVLAAFDQYLDPATGQYNIPAVPLRDIAMSTARLMGGSGAVGVEAMQKFEQATLKGDIANAVTYLTGKPAPATTQGVATMLRDIVQRQGQTAVENRNQNLEYLHMIAPTELEDERRDKLDQAQLVQLHRSAIFKLPTGQFVTKTSSDGGKTWK